MYFFRYKYIRLNISYSLSHCSEVHPTILSPTSPTIIFAEGHTIATILTQLQRLHNEWKIIIIPLDGEAIHGNVATTSLANFLH